MIHALILVDVIVIPLGFAVGVLLAIPTPPTPRRDGMWELLWALSGEGSDVESGSREPDNGAVLLVQSLKHAR